LPSEVAVGVVVSGLAGVAGGVAGLAGALLACGTGRYNGPRCPHAANEQNIAELKQRRAKRDTLKAAFTIKISV
jgi:hypothetical protein